jgi:VanZ family protein
MRAFLKSWLPVLVWMAIIFTASADSHSYEHSSRIVFPLLHWLFPRMPLSEMQAIHEFCRKCCHVTEYAIFGLLVFRALSISKKELPPVAWPRLCGALLIVFLYASSDEFHQRFVPTRTAKFSDVLIDTAGGAAGLFLAWHFYRRRKPQRQA